NARKVSPNLASIEKDGSTCIASFDTAVEVVPFAGPADWGGGALHHVQGRDILLLDKPSQQCERSVQNSAVIRSGDQPVLAPIPLHRLEPEPVWAERMRRLQGGKIWSHVFQRAKEESIFGRQRCGAAVLSWTGAQRANQLLPSTEKHGTAPDNRNQVRSTSRRFLEAFVTQPRWVSSLGRRSRRQDEGRKHCSE